MSDVIQSRNESKQLLQQQSDIIIQKSLVTESELDNALIEYENIKHAMNRQSQLKQTSETKKHDSVLKMTDNDFDTSDGSFYNILRLNDSLHDTIDEPSANIDVNQAQKAVSRRINMSSSWFGQQKQSIKHLEHFVATASNQTPASTHQATSDIDSVQFQNIPISPTKQPKTKALKRKKETPIQETVVPRKPLNHDDIKLTYLFLYNLYTSSIFAALSKQN